MPLQSLAFVLTVFALNHPAQALQGEELREDPWSKASITAGQAFLLETAFGAASAFPLNPHVKNRSRAQQRVLDTAFQLDQPALAYRYAGGIANWRRGAALADLAYYAAAHGLDLGTLAVMDDALAAVADGDRAEDQDWRKQRVLARLSQVHVLLSGAAEASADELSEQDFEDRLAELDRVLIGGSFDQVQSVMNALTRVYAEVFEQPARRHAVESKLAESKGKLPRRVHMLVGLALTETALKHGDLAKALDMLKDAEQILQGGQWLIEDRLPLVARMIELRYQAGDRATAMSKANAERLTYAAERKTIVDIERAGCLRALAECFHGLGQEQTALELYSEALGAGLRNPNSRPRADDLIATCLSMAMRDVEPDAALRLRLNTICDGLGSPW